MLSRIVQSRDAGRTNAAPYVPAGLDAVVPKPTPEESDQAAARALALERENQALIDRLRQLEHQSASMVRDAFENGRRQGDQQARQDLQPVLDRLHASLADLAGLRSEMRRRAEKDVVQLAMLIARRILHREIAVDPNALAALVRVLFERLAHSESYRVTVHPHFATGVLAALPPNLVPKVHIEPDPACAPGTLVSRSDEGLVDASVDAQLEEIGRGMADRLSKGHS